MLVLIAAPAPGLTLKAKTGKQTATVDLDDLRKKTNSYLDEAAKDDFRVPQYEYVVG